MTNYAEHPRVRDLVEMVVRHRDRLRDTVDRFQSGARLGDVVGVVVRFKEDDAVFIFHRRERSILEGAIDRCCSKDGDIIEEACNGYAKKVFDMEPHGLLRVLAISAHGVAIVRVSLSDTAQA